MVITSTKIINLIQWLITVFMISSFLLFHMYTWGKYSFIVCAALIFLLTVVKNRGKIRLRIEPFILILFIFLLYVAITAIWAIEPLESLTKANSVLQILLCFSLIYWAYMEESDYTKLIVALIFAAYVVAVYSVFFFGFDSIIHTSDDILLGESFSNINSIALFLSFGVICDLYLLLFDRFRLHSVVSILSVVIIASTRSRKAIVFLALGFIALLLFRFSKSRSVLFRVFKIVGILILSLTAIYFLSKLSVFVGVNNRLDYMINTFLGSGKMDGSSMMRNDLIEIGIFCWKKSPIIGFGMGSSHYFTSRYLQYDAYLHNNYVELLVGGGIIAFAIYYFMYAYLIYGFFKIRKTAYPVFVFGVVMIGLLLVIDYGRVSYYSKSVYFEIMMLFLILRSSRATGASFADNQTDALAPQE